MAAAAVAAGPGPGQTCPVSRVARFDVALPPDVEVAVMVLSGRLRVALLHELARGPRTTSELIAALGAVERTTLIVNLGDLEEHGVVVGAPATELRPGRTTTWSLHRARLGELTKALSRHVTSRR